GTIQGKAVARHRERRAGGRVQRLQRRVRPRPPIARAPALSLRRAAVDPRPRGQGRESGSEKEERPASARAAGGRNADGSRWLKLWGGWNRGQAWAGVDGGSRGGGAAWG